MNIPIILTVSDVFDMNNLMEGFVFFFSKPLFKVTLCSRHTSFLFAFLLMVRLNPG